METSVDIYNGFEQMWASEWQYVRRMLIGLTKDIDLADDLLQETYLKARSGIASYRGDNDRAWLSTIAKNLFLAHVRRRYVGAETDYEETEDIAFYSPVGASDHLELINVRQAISELDPALRNALLMKHYCGFTYREIAERVSCPVGTAQWRVSHAVGKLKEALGISEEAMEVKCADLSRTRILDYLYGTLDPEQSEAVKRHLRDCRQCRSRIDGTRKILTALDALESDLKHMQIIELDEEGMFKLYTVTRFVNTSDKPMDELDFVSGKRAVIEYLAAQGEELAFTVEEEHDNTNYPNTYLYKAKLPKPVAPGEACDYMVVYPSLKHPAVQQEPDGSWTFGWSQLTSVENECVFVLAVRLPSSAHSITTDPPVTEQRSTTLLWRSIQPANERFYCEVKYWLDNDKT